MEQSNQKPSLFVRLATWIVDKRSLFFLIYAAALIFCGTENRDHRRPVRRSSLPAQAYQ